jgi:hypothetical protein
LTHVKVSLSEIDPHTGVVTGEPRKVVLWQLDTVVVAVISRSIPLEQMLPWSLAL